MAPAATAARRRASSSSETVETRAPPGHVQLDDVAVADEGQRPADERLGRDVQHAGAVGRAAHARVRDAQHVADALPPAASSGSAACPIPACPARRSAPRAAARAPSPASRSSDGIVDARRHVVVVAEHDGRPAMTSSRGSAAVCLMTAPSGARLPRSTASPPSRDSGRSRGTITRSLKTRASAMFSPSVCPLTVSAPRVQQVGDLVQQGAEPAGVEEVLHQELADGPDVGEHGRGARERDRSRRARSGTPRAARPSRRDG